MLEEALRHEAKPAGTATPSGSTSTTTTQFYSIADTAIALLDFLQVGLPAGGTAAEQRLFQLYGDVCNNIFGPLVVVPDEKAATAVPDSSSKKDLVIDKYRHEYGGWLSEKHPWSRLPSNNRNRMNSLSEQDRTRSVRGSGATSLMSGSMGTPSRGASSSTSTLHHRSPHHHLSSATASSRLDLDPVVMLLGTATPSTAATAGGATSPRTPTAVAQAVLHRRQGGTDSFGSPSSATPRPTVGAPTWVEVLETESANRPLVNFAFPLLGLPPSLQRAYGTLLEEINLNLQQQSSRMDIDTPPAGTAENNQAEQWKKCSDNARRLLQDVLQKPPQDQTELHLYFLQCQQSKQRSGSPLTVQQQQAASVLMGMSPSPPRGGASPFGAASRGLFSPLQATGAPTTPSAAGSSSTSTSATTNTPRILLTLLEYYLLLFVRYPLAAPLPVSTTTTSSGTTTTVRRSKINEPSLGYGEQVYLFCFRRYVNHFLPYYAATSSSSLFTVDEDSWSFSSPQQQRRPPVMDPDRQRSELFLRLVVALWLVAPLDSASGQRGRLPLPPPIMTSSQCPLLVQRCLRSVVWHLVLDPHLAERVRRTSRQSSSSDRQQQQQPVAPWCLSRAMTMVFQPALFRFVVATLQTASIHNLATDSPFYAALNMWLFALEPWNAAHKSKTSTQNAKDRLIGSVSRAAASAKSPGTRQAGTPQRQSSSSQQRLTPWMPRAQDASRYRPEWEAYIVANLYLYAIPLAVFLRRARELDFSSKRFNSSMDLVRRVFRVFSPAVIQVVSRNLAGDDPRYSIVLSRHWQLVGPYVSMGLPAASSRPASRSIVAPVDKKDLSNLLVLCQPDARSLLEEIYMQHSKNIQDLDIIERIGAFFEGLFGQGAVSGDEKVLLALVERVKFIVGLPADYEVDVPVLSRRKGAGAAGVKKPSVAPVRDENGFLTEAGKEQVMTGMFKCDPLDVVFVGDELHNRVLKSHELRILVDFFVWLSDYLTERLYRLFERLGWTDIIAKPPTSEGETEKEGEKKAPGLIRINLRFLADYRNLMFTCFLAYLAMKIVFRR